MKMLVFLPLDLKAWQRKRPEPAKVRLTEECKRAPISNLTLLFSVYSYEPIELSLDPRVFLSDFQALSSHLQAS
jgi:hypothetical protein